MIGDMTLLDKVNFITPPGPGPDPSDDVSIISNISKLSAHGQQTAFAALIADPKETGFTGAARADYFRYIGVAAALGLAIGGAAVYLLKK